MGPAHDSRFMKGGEKSMNTLIVIGVLLVLAWSAISTISYGIWTFRENKKGGIALFILTIVCVAIPLYLLCIRK